MELSILVTYPCRIMSRLAACCQANERHAHHEQDPNVRILNHFAPSGFSKSVSSARSSQVSDPSIYHRKQSDYRQSSRIPDLPDVPLPFAQGADMSCTSSLAYRNCTETSYSTTHLDGFTLCPDESQNAKVNTGKCFDWRKRKFRKTQICAWSASRTGHWHGRWTGLIRQPWTSHRTFDSLLSR